MTAIPGFIATEKRRLTSFMSGNRKKLIDVLAVAGSRITRQAVLMVAMAMGARFLDKAELGIWALINIVVQFAVLLSDAGISTFVVREKELNERVYATVFYACAVLSLVISILSAALIAPISYLLGHADSYLYFLVASVTIFPLGIAGLTQAFLRRQHKFAAIFLIDLFANTALLVGVILMLQSGFGLWSLVIPTLLTTTLGCLILLAHTGIPRFAFDLEILKRAADYSGGLVGFSSINFWSRNADHVMVGKFLGMDALGIYSIAYRIMMLPMSQINSIALTIALPYMSPHQDDLKKLSNILRRMLAIVGGVTTGPVLLVWLYRDVLVQQLLGDGWNQVGDLLTLMLPLAIFQTVASPVGICFQVTGRTGEYFRLGVLTTVALLFSFAIGIWLGSVEHVVYCYTIAILVACPIAIAVGMRSIGCTLYDWFTWCSPYFLCVGLSVAVHQMLASIENSNAMLLIDTAFTCFVSAAASAFAIKSAWKSQSLAFCKHEEIGV